MPQSPRSRLPYEASSRAINRIIGLTALFLPVVMISIWGLGRVLGTEASHICFHDSLSHFYYSRTGGDLFVGMLVAIGLMLICFGTVQAPAAYAAARQSKKEVARVVDRGAIFAAGVAAIGVALFPTRGTGCEAAGVHLRPFAVLDPDGVAVSAEVFSLWESLGYGAGSRLEHLHLIFAALMFALLIYFTWIVFRATDDARFIGPMPRAVWLAQTPQKRARNRLYCGAALLMLVASGALGARALFLDGQAWNAWNGVLVLESLALIPFGLAWLVKGRFIPALNDPDDTMHKLNTAA